MQSRWPNGLYSPNIARVCSWKSISSSVALLRLQGEQAMTDKASPKLIPLGPANRKTRASSPTGMPETIPTNHFKAD